MDRRSDSGLSLLEILILISIVAVLFALSLPSITVGPVKGGGQQVQTLHNMKQLQLATQQMALDGTTTGNTNLGWPGEPGGSFSNWVSTLASGNYLSTNDLCKLLSAAGRLTPPGHLPLTNNNAVLVYAVRADTPGEVVFLSTANFTNTPTGGLPPTAEGKPYGTKGFVIFHKAGDGLILANRQVGTNYTNIIGGFVPLCQ